MLLTIHFPNAFTHSLSSLLLTWGEAYWDV